MPEPEAVLFDRTATDQERAKAIYVLTIEHSIPRKWARKLLLAVALDTTESITMRHEALCGLACVGSTRLTPSLLPILLDQDAPWLLRAEAAHVLGMSHETRRFARRALHTAWKTAPPEVRVYIAYALAVAGQQQAIPLLRESINDFTPSHDLPWTLAQECRWAILCCRGAGGWVEAPEDPLLLSPTWEEWTQHCRAKQRRIRPRHGL